MKKYVLNGLLEDSGRIQKRHSVLCTKLLRTHPGWQLHSCTLIISVFSDVKTLAYAVLSYMLH